MLKLVQTFLSLLALLAGAYFYVIWTAWTSFLSVDRHKHDQKNHEHMAWDHE